MVPWLLRLITLSFRHWVNSGDGFVAGGDRAAWLLTAIPANVVPGVSGDGEVRLKGDRFVEFGKSAIGMFSLQQAIAPPSTRSPPVGDRPLLSHGTSLGLVISKGAAFRSALGLEQVVE